MLELMQFYGMKYWYVCLFGSWLIFRSYRVYDQHGNQTESGYEELTECKTFGEACVQAKRIGQQHGGVTELETDEDDPFLGRVLIFVVMFVSIPGRILDGVFQVVLTVVHREKLDDYNHPDHKSQ